LSKQKKDSTAVVVGVGAGGMVFTGVCVDDGVSVKLNF
jgi:hypothetical protein